MDDDFDVAAAIEYLDKRIREMSDEELEAFKQRIIERYNLPKES